MASARTIEATYRITTPMFCSGADQTRAELRLPSFKGALRFWWRALMWGRVKDVKKLREQEAALFGSSEPVVRQSKVRLQLPVDPQIKIGTQRKWNQSEWQSYSGYGLIEKKQDGGGLPKREFIKPSSEFTVLLRFRGVPEEETSPVLEALKVLGMVGGLGGRSRMGWGSIQLEKMDASASWEPPKTVDAFVHWVGCLLGGYTHEDTPPYTAFSGLSKAAVGPAQQDARSAHKWISELYRAFVRDTRPKSHKEAFGLPRPFCGPHAVARRAGALFIHIHELTTSAVPVVLLLPSVFLPEKTHPDDQWCHAASFLSQIKSEGDLSR